MPRVPGPIPAAESGAVAVSVLVPVLNEERHLATAIASMEAQQLDGEAEFLLIDGGSEDRTREIVLSQVVRDPRFRLLDNPHRTTPYALNIGLREARGTYVARMDSHSEFPASYLSVGVQRLRAGGPAHVSGPQVAAGSGRWSSRVALALNLWLGRGGAQFRRDDVGEIEVDTGFCGIWRRETLLEHGGWEEEWTIDQDFELASRIRAGGGRLVCLPAMRANYVPRDSLRALWRQYWRYGKFRVKTARRHPQSLRRSHLLAPAVVLSAACAVASPSPLRRWARGAFGSYLLALLGVSVRAARTAPARDAAALPLVFATMHFAWGVGFLAGIRRFGWPGAAVRRVLSSS